MSDYNSRRDDRRPPKVCGACGRTVDVGMGPLASWCPLHPFVTWRDPCRACGAPLLPQNATMADGCPCNSVRGINHGLVAKETCTCVECDLEETGSTRAAATPGRESCESAEELADSEL